MSLGCGGVRSGICLAYFEVGFDVNVGAFLQGTKVVVGQGVESMDVMPGSPRRQTS
jgi:hypothetical protein